MSIPVFNAPKYNLTLPVAKLSIEFRPFLTGEQKVLLIAQESKNKTDIINAMMQIVEQCTFGKVNVKTLSIIDLEYIFLKLRCVSSGSIASFDYPCPHEGCKSTNNVKIDLGKIEPTFAPDHTNTIVTDDQKWTFVFTHPSIGTLLNKNFDVDSEIDPFTIISECLEKFFTDNNWYIKGKDFTESEANALISSLPINVTESIVTKHFNKLPKLNTEVDYKCKTCGYSSKIKVDNFTDFFTL